MIKFFRHIRKSLLMENKTGKYLKYAIGEVILVMIGILLALQVNNWNEQRKGRIFEKKLISDIGQSINSNIWQLNRSIIGSNKHIKSAEIILLHFKNNLAYHDSLDTHFAEAFFWNEPTIKNIGFESLKSYGLNTIKNDSIRERLNIYETGWLEIFNNRLTEYHYNTASPILIELFQSLSGKEGWKPNDYEALKKSKVFATLLRTSIGQRKEQIRWYTTWLESLEKLESEINKELSKNDN